MYLSIYWKYVLYCVEFENKINFIICIQPSRKIRNNCPSLLRSIHRLLLSPSFKVKVCSLHFSFPMKLSVLMTTLLINLKKKSEKVENYFSHTIVLKRSVHWNIWNLKCIFLKGTDNHFQMFFLLSVRKIHYPLRSILGLFSSQSIFVYLWPFPYEEWENEIHPLLRRSLPEVDLQIHHYPGFVLFCFFPKNISQNCRIMTMYNIASQNRMKNTKNKIKSHTVINCSIIYYDSTNNWKSHSKGFKMCA